jgi:GT2 family glycosyltransferase
MNKKIGLVTVLYKSDTVLEGFLKSIQNQSYTNFHIYFVDNSVNTASTVLLKELLDKYNLSENSVHIEVEGNVGIAKGNNIGIKQAITEGCDYVLLINNDIEFYESDIFDNLMLKMQTNAIVCPKIFYFEPKDTIWYAGSHINNWTGLSKLYGNNKKDAPEYSEEKIIGYASTCFLMLDKKVFEKVGLMDENYFVYFDDSDFSMRCNAKGFNCLFVPNIHIYHKISHSSGGTYSPLYLKLVSEGRFYFILKNFSGLSKVTALTIGITRTVQQFLFYKKLHRKAIVEGVKNGLQLIKKERAIDYIK